MEKAAEDMRRMAAEGAGLLAMIETLRLDEEFRLTPLHLLRILDEAVGIPGRSPGSSWSSSTRNYGRSSQRTRSTAGQRRCSRPM